MAHSRQHQKSQPETIVPDEATEAMLENIADASEINQLVQEMDIDADVFKAFLKATRQENRSEAKAILEAIAANQRVKDRPFKP